MRKHNVLETEKRQAERRKQIKTTTLSKRFLAAFLSLVFIISVVPASLMLSMADTDKETSPETTLVEEVKVVDPEEKEEIKEEKKEEGKDKNTKAVTNGISMMNIPEAKAVEVVEGIRVSIDGEAQKNKDKLDVLATVKEGIVKESSIVSYSNEYAIPKPDEKYMEGIYVYSKEDGKAVSRKVYAVKKIKAEKSKDKIYYSLENNPDMGIELEPEKEQYLYLNWVTRYKVKYIVNGNDIALDDDNKYKTTGLELTGSQYVYKENDKLKIETEFSDGYELEDLKILSDNEDITSDCKEDIIKNNTCEISSNTLKGNVLVNINVKEQDAYKIKTVVDGGNFDNEETIKQTKDAKYVGIDSVKVKKGNTAHIIIDSQEKLNQYGKYYYYMIKSIKVNGEEVQLPTLKNNFRPA